MTSRGRTGRRYGGYDDPSTTTVIDTLIKTGSFLPRAWLTGAIEAQLSGPDCRYVLLQVPSGAGKSTVMACMTGDHPDWLRYFIRRDSRAPCTVGTRGRSSSRSATSSPLCGRPCSPPTNSRSSSGSGSARSRPGGSHRGPRRRVAGLPVLQNGGVRRAAGVGRGREPRRPLREPARDRGPPPGPLQPTVPSSRRPRDTSRQDGAQSPDRRPRRCHR